MIPDRQDAENAIERRYGTVAAEEWQLVLRHFEFSEGFSLLLLLVPDGDGAEICFRELEGYLAERQQHLLRLNTGRPEELRKMATTLLDLTCDPDIGAVWLSGVVATSANDYDEWADAWRFGLAGLNQQRNPLRRTFACTLLIVGAPWLPEVFRAIAPDLWSVRTLVVRIEPIFEPDELRRRLEPEPAAGQRAAQFGESWADPSMALQEAARLRGKPGHELELADLLQRAGDGFYEKGDFAAAEASFREALELRTKANDSAFNRGVALARLGLAVVDQGRPGEAETLFRQALDVEIADRASATSRSVTLHELALAVRDQGRAAEAETLFRQALALAEEGGDTATSRGITAHELARAVLDQGRAAEAEALFRQALALKEEGGDTADSRGFTTHALGRAIRDQGRAAQHGHRDSRAAAEEAETFLRQALALAEVGSTATSRGIVAHDLALALLYQGRASEAEVVFRQALALKEEGGDTTASRGVTTHELARTVHAQGRAAEAETLSRKALALMEEGGSPDWHRGITLGELARAVHSEGRAADAEKLLRQAIALMTPGATASQRSVTLRCLASAVLDQGRGAEAEDLFRQALSLVEKGRSSVADVSAILRGLSRAVREQGRSEQADQIAREAETVSAGTKR